MNLFDAIKRAIRLASACTMALSIIVYGCVGAKPASQPVAQSEASEKQVSTNPSGTGGLRDVSQSVQDAGNDTKIGIREQTQRSADKLPQSSVAIAETSPAACPEDMVHIEHDFCPEVQRVCLKEEYNKANRITICHEFKPTSTKCLKPRQKLNYCIDKYEYPNRKGAHPAWMVSWHDAEATCKHLGKRTCWDWEWVAACEGPNETPFPYGWKRDNSKCNIDNIWIEPHIDAMYSNKAHIANRELSRLDQSVPSGAMQQCVSGYGVFDLTGNLDEWVTRAARDKRVSQWSGLKGGAWGHVRNACRPMTTSHAPEFTYYFISFRCCKDPEGQAPFVPEGSSPPPNIKPKDKARSPEPIHPPGPSKTKVRPH